MSKSKAVLVADSEFLENAITLLAKNGDKKLLTLIANECNRLKASRTRSEILLSDRAIGPNFAIGQFNGILAKVGFVFE